MNETEMKKLQEWAIQNGVSICGERFTRIVSFIQNNPGELDHLSEYYIKDTRDSYYLVRKNRIGVRIGAGKYGFNYTSVFFVREAK